MKIDKSDIAGRLAKIKTAIPGKSATFGVQGVLIRGNKAIANNYEIGITATLPVEADKTFILPLKAIEMIDSLPDGEIEILSGVDHKITIITNGIKNTFSWLNPDEFQEPSALEGGGQNFKIESKKLHEIVSSVMYAASTNESKPVYTGVLFEAQDGELNVVALDGYRVAWNKTALDGDFKFIVPRTTLDKLLKIGITGDIEISLGKNNAVFASEEYTVYTRLLSGEFMNYRKTFSTNYKHMVEVPRKALLECLGRILICVEERLMNPAFMTFSGEKLTLGIQSSIANYSEEIDLKGTSDESLKIGFNSHYLRDAVRSYNSDFVTMAFGSALQPMIMSDGNLCSLVLPVRRND